MDCRLKWVAGVAIVVLCACGPQDQRPRHADFTVGMSRAQIIERFGRPQRTQTLQHSAAVIFGPIEGFWPKVPPGSTVEIWSYMSTHTIDRDSSDRSSGHTELYFIDDSNLVQGTGFAMQGAFYESTR